MQEVLEALRLRGSAAVLLREAMSLLVRELRPGGGRIGICNYCGCINDSHPICGACGLLLDGKLEIALEIARDAEFADGPFCKFCQRWNLDEPPMHCDWPVEKYTRIRADEILHGDVLEYGEGGAFRVVEIEASTCGILLISGEVRNPRGQRVRPGKLLRWERHITALVRARRSVACSVPVCEFHAREVGEDRHWCMEHWNSWEQAA